MDLYILWSTISLLYKVADTHTTFKAHINCETSSSYEHSSEFFDMAKDEVPQSEAGEMPADDIESGTQLQGNRLKDFYAHPWTQIILISFICFCCPGVRYHFFIMM